MSAAARPLCAAAFAALTTLAAAPGAHATGFTDIGQDLRAHRDAAFEAHGMLRARGEWLYDLDLDRGLTPSGQPLYPVPASDPAGQSLVSADLRLRTDLAAYALDGGVAVKVRIDAPADLVLGSEAVGIPAGSATQRPITAIAIRRAYGEALTPVGLLAVGRMGAHWGLGMLTNGGDCADCDGGDAADRIAFATPLAGHIWAAAFDFSASGPFVARRDGARAVDIDPSDDVRTVTFALLRWRDDLARARRRKADKLTLEYGALLSHRWQNQDVPATYLPTTQPLALRGSTTMARGYRATALDGWLRFTSAHARVEAEAAVLVASVDQPSLVPGALYRVPVESTQVGAALESELGAPEDRFGAGLDAGYASGDPAPGFGVSPGISRTPPQAGDLDGPQASPPGDARVDNFRFHPDYRVDRILFREIVGTVTDAIYLRPHARWTVLRVGPSSLSASLAAVASWAVEATSTPGGRSPLGVEIDPTLAYENRDGFAAALEHAALFPLSGLDNPRLHASAQPAQLVRLRLSFVF